ncbi:response regulator [Cytophagaceae bacterium ABcell3]|nr:response regulator [Cytophagaceae bacterium ABcell3]
MKKINGILLIDDDGTTNLVNRRLIERKLPVEKLLVAVNGEQALNILQNYIETHNQKAPELIVLDLNMPFMDGFEFLEYFKRKNFCNKTQVRLIILTNSTYEKDKEQFDKIREDKWFFMQKPLTEDKLKKALDYREMYV